MFFHYTGQFDLLYLELSYISFGCTPKVFFRILFDKMPKVLQYFWDVFGKLFFSRLQTFSIILMSDEIGDQFSRVSNPFSENQVFERIELCAGALSCCNFSPKNISGNRLSCKICKYLIEFIVPQTFWRHFRPSWAIKPQSINCLPPNFRVSDKFFYSVPVLGKRRTNTRLLECSSRVVSSENSSFCQKILGSKACSFARTFLACRFLAVR